MRFELKPYHHNTTEEEFLQDLRKVAQKCETQLLTQKQYSEYGEYSISTIRKRFGSWENALYAAGLNPTRHDNIQIIELFEDIEAMWMRLGRQPTTTDVNAGISKYSLNTFLRHCGSWRKALESFVEYINTEQSEHPEDIENDNSADTMLKQEDIRHVTSRNIDLRLRFLVLSRDNFSCCSCGASPAKDGGITQLHIDHIKPWSKGGETVIDNLQTLCSKCNLGKSDMELL